MPAPAVRVPARCRAGRSLAHDGRRRLDVRSNLHTFVPERGSIAKREVLLVLLLFLLQLPFLFLRMLGFLALFLATLVLLSLVTHLDLSLR